MIKFDYGEDVCGGGSWGSSYSFVSCEGDGCEVDDVNDDDDNDDDSDISKDCDHYITGACASGCGPRCADCSRLAAASSLVLKLVGGAPGALHGCKGAVIRSHAGAAAELCDAAQLSECGGDGGERENCDDDAQARHLRWSWLSDA